jgi:hypothetical protein
MFMKAYANFTQFKSLLETYFYNAKFEINS